MRNVNVEDRWQRSGAHSVEAATAGAALAAVFGACDLSIGSNGRATAEKIARGPLEVFKVEIGAMGCNQTRRGMRAAGVPHSVLLIGTAGEARLQRHNALHNFMPGDVAWLSGFAPFRLDIDERFAGFVVRVPDWCLLRRPDHVEVAMRLRLPREGAFAEALFAGLAALLDSRSEAEAVLASELFLDVLHHTLRSTGPEEDAIALTGRGLQILLFMVSNVGVIGLSPRDAAKHLRCSLRTIHNSCAHSGSSFNETLLAIRLSIAGHRLVSTKDQISKVAFDVGFSEQANLSRAFKKRNGVTPKQFRNGILGV